MTDLDLPLLPSAEQIRRREFATVRRGYDPDQVRDYLGQVAIQVETLETELRDERLGSPGRTTGQTPAVKPEPKRTPAPAPAAAAPATTSDAYEKLSKRFATVLQTADAEAQRVAADAKAQAEKLVADARVEADKIRVDAQATAEATKAKSSAELDRAHEEARRLLGGLEQRRETMVTQMHEMQSKLITVAKELEIPMDDDDLTVTPDAPPTTASTAPTTTPSSTPAPAPAMNQPNLPPKPKEATWAIPESPKTTDDDLVDPRYEDLWTSPTKRSVDIPDLAAIDIDFEDDKE
jgi:DivIVA domain-containing protein